MLHDWPGNVQESENRIEYAVAMTQQNMITEDYILQTKTINAPEPVKPLREARQAFEKGLDKCLTFSISSRSSQGNRDEKVFKEKIQEPTIRQKELFSAI